MANERVIDDLDLHEATLTPEEREEVAAASVALDLAGLVYVAREHLGLTQKEAAERTGVQQQMISRLEGGTAQPTFKTVERYLRKLGFAMSVSVVDQTSAQLIDQATLNDEGAEVPAEKPVTAANIPD